MYRRVATFATVIFCNLLGACGEPTEPTPNIVVECNQGLDVNIQCNDNEVNGEGEGGAGGGGGASAEGSVRLDVCHWAYNMSDPGYAVCMPTLRDGEELISVAITIDPPNMGYKPPGNKPTLGLYKTKIFSDGDSWETVDQKPDPSVKTSQWEEEHEITLVANEVISLDLFEYRMIFDPYESLPYTNSIIKTVAVYR